MPSSQPETQPINQTAAAVPLDFWRALAAHLRGPGPSEADARRLVRLIDRHAHLAHEAARPDGAIAKGLASSLLPAIEVAASRLRL